MREALIKHILSFLKKHFPDIEGCLWFGSSTETEEDFYDIDLLLFSYSFSYVSKASYTQKNKINLTKVPLHGLMDLLAEDFKDGIYKNIFKNGIILVDEAGLLKFVKNFVVHNYPSQKNVVKFHLSNTTKQIVENYYSLKNKQSAYVEKALAINQIIQLLAKFQILLDGVTHIQSSKHIGRYIKNNHPQLSCSLTDCLNTFYSNGIPEGIESVTNLIEGLNIPHVTNCSNDYILDLFENGWIYYYVNKNINLDEAVYIRKRIYKILNKNSFYLYSIDYNNIEEMGMYLALNAEQYDNNKVKELKELLEEIFSGKLIYVPYNLFFNQDIKFGGKDNLFFINNFLQKLEYLIKTRPCTLNQIIEFVVEVVSNTNLNREKISFFFLSKVFNNQHNTSFADVNCQKENVMKEHMKIKNELAPELNTISSLKKHQFLSLQDYEILRKMPNLIVLNFIDRALSMYFIDDSKKLTIILLSLY